MLKVNTKVLLTTLDKTSKTTRHTYKDFCN